MILNYLRYRLTVGLIIAFLFSFLSSCNELRYVVSGKTAEATVVSAREAISADSRSTPVTRVVYHFSDKTGRDLEESDAVPIDYPVQFSQKITVEYIPGADDSSRIAGHRHLGSVYLFVVVMMAGIIWFALLWYEGVRTSPNRGRKYR